MAKIPPFKPTNIPNNKPANIPNIKPVQLLSASPPGSSPPTPSREQFIQFGMHILEKNPAGVDLKGLEKHVDHHKPGEKDEDPFKETSALYAKAHFTQIDVNKDGKLMGNEIADFGNKFLPVGPPVGAPPKQ